MKWKREVMKYCSVHESTKKPVAALAQYSEKDSSNSVLAIYSIYIMLVNSSERLTARDTLTLAYFEP